VPDKSVSLKDNRKHRGFRFLGSMQLFCTPPKKRFIHFSNRLLVLGALVFVSSSCESRLVSQNIVTPTLYIITATLPPTLTPRPSDTPPPATLVPTITPVEGTTTSQVNVREQPSTLANSLGILGIFVKVQIIGKDPSGSWYQIIYAGGTEGKGWVTAAYVQVLTATQIPVIAVVPATQPSPSGMETLPIVAETEQREGTITPTRIPPALTPTVVPALQDGDSKESPIVNVSFSPAGPHSFQYTGDVSAPEGDPEDWVQFKPYAQVGQPVMVTVTMNCAGNSTLDLELWQIDSRLQTWQAVACDHPSRLLLSLYGGAPYFLRLLPTQDYNSLRYIHYTLLVETTP
jgi:uncharacterized protein YraI